MTFELFIQSLTTQCIHLLCVFYLPLRSRLYVFLYIYYLLSFIVYLINKCNKENIALIFLKKEMTNSLDFNKYIHK